MEGGIIEAVFETAYHLIASLVVYDTSHYMFHIFERSLLSLPAAVRNLHIVPVIGIGHFLHLPIGKHITVIPTPRNGKVRQKLAEIDPCFEVGKQKIILFTYIHEIFLPFGARGSHQFLQLCRLSVRIGQPDYAPLDYRTVEYELPAVLDMSLEGRPGTTSTQIVWTPLQSRRGSTTYNLTYVYSGFEFQCCRNPDFSICDQCEMYPNCLLGPNCPYFNACSAQVGQACGQSAEPDRMLGINTTSTSYNRREYPVYVRARAVGIIPELTSAWSNTVLVEQL